MATLIVTPYRDVPSWADALSRVDIPVLPETIASLAALAEDEDRVDAQGIAEVVARDPMMSVKVYRHMASLRRGSQQTDVENLTGCVVMMGVPPFFRAFRELQPLDLASSESGARGRGLSAVLRRATRAADYAFDWALRRNDFDAEIISTAALLHDFAEMLLWSAAPALTEKVGEVLAENPGMRSAEAQKAVLNIEINALQHELLARWRLPELLVRITDDRDGTDPKVRNVTLAVALARHSARGWDDPALPDDYTALGELLNIPAVKARMMVAGHPSPHS